MARNFYEKLYGADEYDHERRPYLDFPALSNHEIQCLNCLFCEVEIKATLFQMALLKAPGSEGQPLIFSKKLGLGERFG